MGKIPFKILDVFAERKFAGNQLAVCWDDGILSTEEMQTIAREINFSETTFIAPEGVEDGGHGVRIFTPQSELPFAGHPTLGTAWVLREFEQAGDDVRLNLKVGQIPVCFAEDGLGEMTQNPPLFGETFDRAELARILRIDEEDIVVEFPIQIVSTGVPTLVVPLSGLDALKRATVNRDSYDSLIERTGMLTLQVFCCEGQEEGQGLAARVFADCAGIPEDAATGSAAGNLAGYLSQYEVFGSSTVEVAMGQGYEMGRPSCLYLKSRKRDEGQIEVKVGGRVQLVGSGEWFV